MKCKYCGKELPDREKGRKQKQFCSDEHRSKYHQERIPLRTTSAEKIEYEIKIKHLEFISLLNKYGELERKRI